MAENALMTTFQRGYRIFRWCILAVLVLAVALALKRPGHVPEIPDPLEVAEKAREFESKLQQLQEAKNRGESGTQVTFSANEVNAFLAQSMVSQIGATAPGAAPSTDNSSANPNQGAIKDFRIGLDADTAVGFFFVDFHGKDLAITMSGRPGTTNGYLTFSATAFKVGSLSLPVMFVDPVLQKKLQEPPAHERLKLPEFISDLSVQQGQIVLTER